MATINPIAGRDGSAQWLTITESDTPSEITIPSGEYTITIEGAFGGGSIDVQYGKREFTSLGDSAIFTEAGSVNAKIGSGKIKPVRTGGSSMSVNVYIERI